MVFVIRYYTILPYNITILYLITVDSYIYCLKSMDMLHVFAQIAVYG